MKLIPRVDGAFDIDLAPGEILDVPHAERPNGRDGGLRMSFFFEGPRLLRVGYDSIGHLEIEEIEPEEIHFVECDACGKDFPFKDKVNWGENNLVWLWVCPQCNANDKLANERAFAKLGVLPPLAPPLVGVFDEEKDEPF